MFLGYHAYGLVDHYLPDALRVLADVGFAAVMMPLAGRLNPQTMSPALCQHIIGDVEKVYQSTGLRIVLDTTCPFTFSPSHPRGLELLGASPSEWPVAREAIEWSLALAQRLGGQPLVIRSGQPASGVPAEAALEQLAGCLDELLPSLERWQVDLALQPAEEQFIHNIAGFQRLLQWFDSPRLKLAVDTATMFRQIEFPLFSALSPVRQRLAYVVFRDPAIRTPAGDWIGQGSVSSDAVIECLQELEYSGGLFMHSWPADHQALDTARAVYHRLRGAL